MNFPPVKTRFEYEISEYENEKIGLLNTIELNAIMAHENKDYKYLNK
jgi:hypothetical protein